MNDCHVFTVVNSA